MSLWPGSTFSAHPADGVHISGGNWHFWGSRCADQLWSIRTIHRRVWVVMRRLPNYFGNLFQLLSFLHRNCRTPGGHSLCLTNNAYAWLSCWFWTHSSIVNLNRHVKSFQMVCNSIMFRRKNFFVYDVTVQVCKIYMWSKKNWQHIFLKSSGVACSKKP